MRFVLSLLLVLFLAGSAEAAIYCIDKTTGSDANDGLAGSGSDCSGCDEVGTDPWENVTKFEGASTLSAGDYGCLKKGETWEVTDTLDINNDGTAGSFASVTGWDTAGNWTNHGGNIWSIAMTEYPRRVQLSSTEYDEAFTAFPSDGDVPSGFGFTSVDSTTRWAWMPIDGAGNTMHLFVYATSNPSSFYSNVEWLDHSGFINYGTYGSGNAPIIECVNVVDGSDSTGNWTDNGGSITNTWYMTFSTDPVHLYFDGTFYHPSEVLSGTGDFPLGSTYRWYFDSGASRLYVYATSNPATFYTTISGLQECVSPLDIDADYVKFDGWELQGGRSAAVKVRTTQGAVIENCTITQGLHGIFAQSGSSPTWIVNNDVVVRNNTIAAGWETASTGWDDSPGEHEGIHFREGNEYWRIYGNAFSDWTHDNFVHRHNSGNASTGNNYNKFWGNTMNNDGTFDGRGVTWDGPTTKATNNEVAYNLILNMRNSSKLDGEYNWIHHNIWSGNSAPSWQSVFGIGLAKHTVLVSLGADQVSNGNIIEHNILHNSIEPCMLVDQQSSPSSTKQNHIIRNNIFSECGTAPAKDANLTDLALVIESGSNVGANTYKNNLVFRTGETSTIEYQGTEYTASTFNDQTGGSPADVISGNAAGDPTFTSTGTNDFTVLTGSPAINAGVTGSAMFDRAGTTIPQGGTATDIGSYESSEAGNAVTGGITITGNVTLN